MQNLTKIIISDEPSKIEKCANDIRAKLFGMADYVATSIELLYEDTLLVVTWHNEDILEPSRSRNFFKWLSEYLYQNVFP